MVHIILATSLCHTLNRVANMIGQIPNFPPGFAYFIKRICYTKHYKVFALPIMYGVNVSHLKSCSIARGQDLYDKNAMEK